MKSTLALVAISVLFPLSAFASISPDVGNGNPLTIMQPWGLSMGDSKYLQIPSGSSFVDEAGISFTCPETTGVFGCVKLVSLDYWKTQARTIAKQTNGYGKYAYWLNH